MGAYGCACCVCIKLYGDFCQKIIILLQSSFLAISGLPPLLSTHREINLLSVWV